MTSGSRVSVIIPVYNRQASSERALRSVIAQSVVGMEVIVFDDGSMPPFELPAALSGRSDIRLLRSDTNGGESAARNAAVTAARGDWIAFLDSDDYWLPKTLRPRLEAAERSFATANDPLTVHVGGFIIDNRRRNHQEVRIPVASKSAVMFASGCWFCPGSTSLVRKEAFDIVGPCDVALHRLQDMDWYLRLALAGGRIEVWKEVVAVIETGGAGSIANVESAVERMREKYTSLSAPLRLSPFLVRRMEAYLDIERAAMLAAHNNWLQGSCYMARSLARVPRVTLHLEDFWQRRPINKAVVAAASLAGAAQRVS